MKRYPRLERIAFYAQVTLRWSAFAAAAMFRKKDVR